MTLTFEEIAEPYTSEQSSPVVRADLQRHFESANLDPIDTIYFESKYFTDLYNLGVDELVHYAHQSNISLSYDSNPVHFFKILRTIIYYMDMEVQQALLEYNTPNVQCRERNPDTGKIKDTITMKEISPHRMVVIPASDGVNYNCFDIVSLSKHFDRERANMEDMLIILPPVAPEEEPDVQIQYSNPATNEEISDSLVNQIIGGKNGEKAWWAAYREDFSKNIPYIPEKDQPHKYKQWYETMEVVANHHIVDLLDNSGYVHFIINHFDLDELLAEVDDINYPYDESNTLLHMVVKYNQVNTIAKINRLVEQGADVNDQNINGDTPLMLATQLGDIEIMKALIAVGADLNILNHNEYTALFIAVEQDNPSSIKELITAGARVSQQNTYGYTALIWSAELNHIESMKVLLKSDILPSVVNIQDQSGDTALIVAANLSNIEIMMELLAAGSDVNLFNQCKQTALTKAVRNKNVEGVRLLISYGADVNIVDSDGDTVLMTAAISGETDIMLELIARGPDVNFKNIHGHTALNAAVKMSRNANSRNIIAAIRILVNHGADTNVRDSHGTTPLMIGISRKNTEVVKELINLGVQLNVQNDSKDTALIRATHCKDVDIMELLIIAGADPNIQGRFGDTALMVAINHGADNKVLLLIEAGANLNIKNDQGNTALMVAFENIEYAMVLMELLLIHGANPDITDNVGDTVLIRATYNSRLSLIRLLLTHEADPDIRNNIGETALIIAAKKHDKVPLDRLLEVDIDINSEDSSGHTALFYITDVDHAQRLISKGIHIDHENKQGQTALFTVSNHMVIRTLLDQGANVNHLDHKGRTALFYTTQLDKAQTLITYGIQDDHQDHDGNLAVEVMRERSIIIMFHQAGATLTSELLEWIQDDPAVINHFISYLDAVSGDAIPSYLEDRENRGPRFLYNELSELYSWRFARWAVHNSQIILNCCQDTKEYTYHYDEEINNIIRHEDEPWTDDSYNILENIYRALERTTPLPEDTIVYRGERSYGDMTFDNIQIGDLLNRKGFSSFTLSLKVAKQFKPLGMGYILHATFPAGLKGLFLDLNFDTSHWMEKEMLTYPNLQFEVISKYRLDDYNQVIEVKLIGTGETDINQIYR